MVAFPVRSLQCLASRDNVCDNVVSATYAAQAAATTYAAPAASKTYASPASYASPTTYAAAAPAMTYGAQSISLQWHHQNRQTSCIYNASRNICTYYLRGYCKFGSDCRAYHPPPFQCVDSNGASNRTCRLPAEKCRVCGTITDPPHWGNECPWKGIA